MQLPICGYVRTISQIWKEKINGITANIKTEMKPINAISSIIATAESTFEHKNAECYLHADLASKKKQNCYTSPRVNQEAFIGHH